MSAEYYQTLPPWGSARAWREINQTLAHLMGLYRSNLDRPLERVQAIRARLEPIFVLMDDICDRTCPGCHETCCSVARVWLNFQDLLFIHLLGQTPPPLQTLPDLKAACAYLGPIGCTLPRIMRPWFCTRYICIPQQAFLRKKGRAFMIDFEGMVHHIEAARNKMESEFIRVIS
jgi:hypothetical protein